MPSLALILRYLLIVALCWDGSASLWRASAMAVTDVQHASLINGDAVAVDEQCEDHAGHDQTGAVSDDCNCGLDSECCACAFTVATITHTVPFAARHRTSDLSPVHFGTLVALDDYGRVFRPPIG